MTENKFSGIQKKSAKIIQKSNVLRIRQLNSMYGIGIAKDVLDAIRKKDEDDTLNRKINS